MPQVGRQHRRHSERRPKGLEPRTGTDPRTSAAGLRHAKAGRPEGHPAARDTLYASGMDLSRDERELLRLISQAPEPVAMFDLFPQISTAPRPELDSPDDDPVRVTWAEEQLALGRASVELWKRELVRVVHPANGERPDLVEATDAGRAALLSG